MFPVDLKSRFVDMVFFLVEMFLIKNLNMDITVSKLLSFFTSASFSFPHKRLNLFNGLFHFYYLCSMQATLLFE